MADNIVKENETEEIFPFFKILLKNWLVILLVTVLCGLMFLGYSVISIKPTYTASRSFILRTTMEGNQANLANQATLAKRYFSTLEHVIKSPNAIDEVNDEYENVQNYNNYVLNAQLNGETPLLYDEWLLNPQGGTIDKKDLEVVSANAINIDYQDTSLIFKISYTDINDNLAIDKLDVLINTFRVSDIFKESIMASEVQLIETQQDWLVEKSTVYLKYSAIGLIIGAVLSIVIVLLVYVFDNKIKDKKEYEQLTGVSVIAYINKETPQKKRKK